MNSKKENAANPLIEMLNLYKTLAQQKENLLESLDSNMPPTAEEIALVCFTVSIVDHAMNKLIKSAFKTEFWDKWSGFA